MFEIIAKFDDDSIKTLATREEVNEAVDLANHLADCNVIIAVEVYDWNEDESVVLITK